MNSSRKLFTSFIGVLWIGPPCGNALAQRNAPPHAGAAAIGGSGGLGDFLLVIGGIFVGVLILLFVLVLLEWLLSMPRVLWRKLREVLRK